MKVNQTEYSWLEQRSVIKFLEVEKYIRYEIYTRMFDVYKEACFSQKSIYKWIRRGFATTSLSQKDSRWSETTPTLR